MTTSQRCNKNPMKTLIVGLLLRTLRKFYNLHVLLSWCRFCNVFVSNVKHAFKQAATHTLVVNYLELFIYSNIY